MWYNNRYCCNIQASGQAENARATASAAPAPETPQTKSENEDNFVARFSVNDGLAFKAASPDHFTFNRSLAVPNIPAGMQSALEQIAGHMKANPSRVLSLTGLYAANEENNTQFDNLGLARANSIKEKLVALGVPQGAIQLLSRLQDDLSFKDNVLEGGVNFEFGSNNLGDTEDVNAAKALEELGKSLKAGPLKLYFETNSSTIIRTDEVNKFLKDAKYYMSKVPGAKLSVSGHTDSRGATDINERLSKRRADATKDWLSRNGFDASKIITSGKGESQPIADNTTTQGMALNRRAEIIIIE